MAHFHAKNSVLKPKIITVFSLIYYHSRLFTRSDPPNAKPAKCHTLVTHAKFADLEIECPKFVILAPLNNLNILLFLYVTKK
jgi:hypothetical protein